MQYIIKISYYAYNLTADEADRLMQVISLLYMYYMYMYKSIHTSLQYFDNL